MKPLISIITPTYNHERFIEKCVESTIDQTYENWEQIIIDDGSTDQTADLIAEFNDKRITYIKQNNLGIYNLKETYNKALNLSKGEYIAVLEGDDYWPDYKLEEQIKAFKNPDVILAWGNAQMVNEDDEIECLIHDPQSFPKISSTYETLDKLLLRNFIPACTVLCRKNALSVIGGFQQAPSSPCIDYSTWLQLSKLGNFYYEDRVMGYWRWHLGQTSTKKASEMMNASFTYSMKFYDDMGADEKDLLTIDFNDIIKLKNQMFAEMDFNSGRRCLYEKQWEKGKNYFKSALNGTNLIKIYAIIGIICSYFKVDMESFISILNKPHINKFE